VSTLLDTVQPADSPNQETLMLDAAIAFDVPATQRLAPQNGFLFATGIENSAPTIQGGRVRRDQMAACGHYALLREDLGRVRELGCDALRYGDRRDIREERREFYDAGRDLRRSEQRAYNRGYGYRYDRYDRGYDRYDRRYDRYDRGYYRSGRGYWNDWRVGYYVPRNYWGPAYYAPRYWDRYLYAAPRGHRWYRHGDGAFLIAFDGRLRDVRFGISF